MPGMRSSSLENAMGRGWEKDVRLRRENLLDEMAARPKMGACRFTETASLLAKPQAARGGGTGGDRESGTALFNNGGHPAKTNDGGATCSIGASTPLIGGTGWVVSCCFCCFSAPSIVRQSWQGCLPSKVFCTASVSDAPRE